MRLKALCIGINNYPGTGNDLYGCVNDAHDWAAELVRRGFEASTLLDEQATGEEIRNRIASLIGSAEGGDTIVVQFSGHGSFVPDRNGDEPDGTDECICPSDAGRGYITDDDLFDLFSVAKTDVRIIMIADSCHSGSIARFAPIAVPFRAADGTPAPQRRVRFLPPATFLGSDELQSLGDKRALRRASAPGRRAALTLSGCQDAEFSYDDFFRGRPNGVFSYVALEALKSLPPGATYTDWHNAIRRKLPSPLHPQTPNLYGSRKMKISEVFSPRRP
jgi:hypothetical protein